MLYMRVLSSALSNVSGLFNTRRSIIRVATIPCGCRGLGKFLGLVHTTTTRDCRYARTIKWPCQRFETGDEYR